MDLACCDRARKTKSVKSNDKKLRLPGLVVMGIGGMIGGCIFSVLGIAVEISGHPVLWHSIDSVFAVRLE